MRKRLGRKKRIKKLPGISDALRAPVVMKRQANKNNSAFYKSGAMLAMPNIIEQSGDSPKNTNKFKTSIADAVLEPSLLPPVTGKGSPAQDVGMASSVSLEGRTDAEFDGGSFSTQDVQVSTVEDCESCGEEGQCIRARGVLVARYHVTTTVTLPSVDDFPDLTRCQRTRVQNAIDNVLAPHEQEHVQAFRQYNGVTRTPFDVTLCRSEFSTTIQDMFDRQENSRQASAQAASDALDPFNFTVDIDCEEPSEETSESTEEGKEPDVEGGVPEEDNVTPTDESETPAEESVQTTR